MASSSVFFHSLWDDSDEEEEAPSSSLSTQTQTQNFLADDPDDKSCLIGFVTANVVGLQYYDGAINGREMVWLCREPTNAFDCNAIIVSNMAGHQVGHIERAMAAKLSPHIDSGSILVGGIVYSGKNRANRFKLPIQIHIFCELEARDQCLGMLRDSGLNLISPADPTFSTSVLSVAGMELCNLPSQKDEEKRLDQIFRSFRVSRRRVSMDASGSITSELMPHQKEALAWMVHRENSSELPPFWEICNGGSGFRNVLTNFETKQRPCLKGGILADDMGLGKTISLLSLIATNRPGAAVPKILSLPEHSGETEEEEEEEEEEGKKNKNQKKRKRTNKKKDAEKQQESTEKEEEEGKKNKNPKKRKRTSKKKDAEKQQESTEAAAAVEENVVYTPPDPNGPRTTLVVCPPSVISTWIQQLEEHTRTGALKVHLYHGANRAKNAKQLFQYDLVLSTYNTLGLEFKSESSPALSMQWLRVILDEAHYIKNASANQAKAVKSLKADRRWAVTGTPIQNSSNDLFGLVSFLQFQPFSERYYWTSLLQRPLLTNRRKGLDRLQVLVEAISLRRTKDTEINGKKLVELPPKTVTVFPVELSSEERALYNAIETEGKKVVQKLIRSGTVLANYSNILQIILRLRQICDDSSICPADIDKLVLSFGVKDASGEPDLLRKLLSVLQDGDDFDCPVCLSPPVEAIITICSHVFCKTCIQKTMASSRSRCPMCRRDLTPADTFTAPKPTPESKSDSAKAANVSSKVKALLSLLRESRKDNPTKKSVIFSQFCKMLDRLQGPLQNEGFNFVRIDGMVPVKKRAALVEEFRSTKPDSPTLLLAGLKAVGVGMNLNAASDVYLLDPWWNPAAENQAMDRVYRIGQKSPVHVTRLIVRDSIEERILEMQKEKQTMASSAFSYDKKKQEEMRIENIQFLMRL